MVQQIFPSFIRTMPTRILNQQYFLDSALHHSGSLQSAVSISLRNNIYPIEQKGRWTVLQFVWACAPESLGNWELRHLPTFCIQRNYQSAKDLPVVPYSEIRFTDTFPQWLREDPPTSFLMIPIRLSDDSFICLCKTQRPFSILWVILHW